MLYEVTFTGRVEINDNDINNVRKENRNFLTSDYFKKDKMIAKIIAYNKVIEAIKKGNETIVDYNIKLIQGED